MIIRPSIFALLIFSLSPFVSAQDVKNSPSAQTSVDPGMKAPVIVAPQQSKAGSATTSESAPPNRADAYYHYQLAHMYEEMVATTGSAEYAGRAIDEFKLAVQNDPGNDFLNAELAELYAKTGQIRDAVNEAQAIIQRDPKNLNARRLLGRIYLRYLGDAQGGTQSEDMLKRAIEQYEKIVALDPTSVEDHLLLGRLYRLHNEIPRAEKEFKTAVAIRPDSEEAVTTLSYLYNENNDPNAALNILESVPVASRTAKLYSALGYTYEQEKDYKKAVEAYRQAVYQDQDNLDSVRGLAQNLLNDGQTDEALEQYKIIAEADPQDAQTFMRIAEIYRRDGRFELALDALQRAKQIVSDSQEVTYNIAVVYEGMGRYDEAAQLLQGLLKHEEKTTYTSSEQNNRAIFTERLGNIYRQQNKPALAVETFRKMIPLGDENAARGYQEIIETYRDAKDWPKAIQAAQEAAKKLPKDRGVQMSLAAQEADAGQADQAIARVRGMLKNSSEDREVWLTLAQMYSRVKRWKEAEDALQHAQQFSTKPEEKDYAMFLTGSLYERQKKYDLAEEAFHKVLASDPKNAGALNYLGYMLADRGTRLEEALGYIRKAVQLDPQNYAYLDSLGWAYFKLGNLELAEENLRKATDRMGTDPTVQDHLADVYQRTGRLKQAVMHWERALQEWKRTVPADVDPSDVAKVQKKLENAKVKLAKEAATHQ